MRSVFPLFSTPIQFCHSLWSTLLQNTETVIDATVGNGKDTLFIAQLLQKFPQATLWGLDIQTKAIENTKKLLSENLTPGLTNIHLIKQSHESFPSSIEKNSVKLIVYNLGYLPGSDKSITTMTSSTLKSLKTAIELMKSGGMISITCYPGHAEGLKETHALDHFLQTLDPRIFSITKHEWINRNASPKVILIQKTTS